MIGIHVYEVVKKYMYMKLLKIIKSLGRWAWIIGKFYAIVYKELEPLDFGV